MKRISKTNFRVIVEPKIYTWFNRDPKSLEKEAEDTCESIISSIKRHVDDVAYLSMKYDTEEVCEFCDREWDESNNNDDPDFPKGYPLCCEEAIEQFKKNL